MKQVAPPFSVFGVPLVLLLLADALSGQAVAGRVTAAESGNPLAGAFVRLFDAEGVQRSALLTDVFGRYSIVAPSRGRFRVRVEFIGRAAAESEWMDLVEGMDIGWSPSLDPNPVRLDGLTVEAARRCVVSPREGSDVATVWAEARKALDVAAWAGRERLFRYTLLSRVRELSLEDRTVLEESTRLREGYFSEPFVSRPAASLIGRGFVQETPRGTYAYAPDAEVLLSREFTETHCFRLRAGPEGLVGLAFEPTRDRTVTDIEGVIWLDADSGYLTSVTFSYRRFPGVAPSVRLGGRVTFERLPSGAWIVRSWSLEMPVQGDVQRRDRRDAWDRRLVALQEVGGEVLRVVQSNGATIFRADRAGVAGAAFDSVRGRPLSGAEVRVAGTAAVVTTDEEGRFHLPGLLPGRYTVRMAHPRLDSLDLPGQGVTVELTEGATTWVSFAIPTSGPSGEGGSGIEGEVMALGTGGPVVGATATLLDVGGRSVLRSLTDRRGRYWLPTPEPGRYQVLLEVLGETAARTEAIDVHAGRRAFHSLPYLRRRVTLEPGVSVPDSVCAVIGGDDLPAGRVWDEVDKGLRSWLAARESGTAFSLVEYQRIRPGSDPDSIWAEVSLPVEGFVAHGFEAPPAEVLDREGYLTLFDSALTAVAPGAALLTSDWFRRRYCVRRVPSGAGPGTVAVAFSSTAVGERPDIHGVAILDRESAVLESLHYRYGSVPQALPNESMGGWMTYRPLPEGGLVLDAWERRFPLRVTVRYRTPLPVGAGVRPSAEARQAPGYRPSASGVDPLSHVDPSRAFTFFREEGGFVRAVRTLDGDLTWSWDASPPRPTFTDSLWFLLDPSPPRTR